MRPPRHQTQLKARLLESLSKADTVTKVKKLIGAVYHFRRTNALTFSQYQDLLEAGERAKVRELNRLGLTLADYESQCAKGGA